MLTTLIKTTLMCCVLLAVIGCQGRGSNWRLHQQKQVTQKPMSNEAAPDWVKGIVPQSEFRIYFVGRSRTPDTPRPLDAYFNIRKNGETLNENAHLYGHPPKEAALFEYDRFYRDPSQRTGYTVMDERDAVQSAREDIFDQIRQRLAPRNMGNAANLLVNNVDSGTCLDCGDRVKIYETSVKICNDECSHGSGNCDKRAELDDTGTSCADCHQSVAHCAGCASIVHAVTQSNRTPDYLTGDLSPLARDINIMNINLESMMPSLAAYLSEEEVYFEKWHVHEGHDHNGRPMAEGRDEWQSYKCWMLCSIPAEEFYSIAEKFRERYDDFYETALDRSMQNRDRRMEWETRARELSLSRQEEEREWNREDEIVTLQHTLEINKDRETIPGRRFTLED